jgi:4-amino-4-deoxy-L-arabinose transferase-like glycosyltransferase
MQLKKIFRQNTKAIIAAGLLFVFAFFLRAYQIDSCPPALNWDEVSHGYNAYSLLKTGKDEWGEPWPLIFRAYGDYKLPLYIYLTLPAVDIFGLNPFSVRLVSILSGTALTLVVFALGLKVTKKFPLALLAGLLTALSPWTLFVSRLAAEANLSAFLFALGILGVYFWWEEKKRLGLSLAVIFWGLSLFAYNSARVIVPVFSLIIFIKAIKEKRWQELFLPAALSLIFLIPLVAQIIDQSGRARFDLVSLIDQGAINRIIEKRQQSSWPEGLKKIAYNRPAYFVFEAGKNFLVNLTPEHLFLSGGSHYQFSLPGHGLLFSVTAPFFLFGLISLWQQKQARIIGIWFLLGILPSAITRDAPHALRSLFAAPAAILLITLGVSRTTEWFWQWLGVKDRLLLAIFTAAVFLSFFQWWDYYLQVYPRSYGWSWQYGYKQVVGFLKDNHKDYKKVYFTKKQGEPHEFILFYWPWPPGEYQDQSQKKWDYHDNWYWVNQFDKFVFLNDWEVKEIVGQPKEGKDKELLVTSPGNYPPGWSRLEVVNFPDGQVAFEILER